MQVVHHDAHDERNLVNVGTTQRGTPVTLNRVVGEADLRILTGSVKPHNQAGYTGGGKSIVPGVAGIDTILANHSSANVSHPRSVLGIIDGPIREDINEVIERFVGPSFLINVIQNPAKEIVGAVSGHPVAAHAQAAATLDSMCKVDTSVLADVVIVGCPDPIGINLYQTMNAMSAPVRVESPVVKLGGHIIVVSRCREGVGHPAFLECVRSSSSVGELHDRVTRPDEVMLDRYAAQIWAETLLYADVVIVTEGVGPQTLGMHMARDTSSRRWTCAVLDTSGPLRHDAPYVIPHYTSRGGWRDGATARRDPTGENPLCIPLEEANANASQRKVILAFVLTVAMALASCGIGSATPKVIMKLACRDSRSDEPPHQLRADRVQELR